jgi:hypothetical protein
MFYFRIDDEGDTEPISKADYEAALASPPPTKEKDSHG